MVTYYNDVFILNSYNILNYSENNLGNPFWLSNEGTIQEVIQFSSQHPMETDVDEIPMFILDNYISINSVCPIQYSFSARGNINMVSNFKFKKLVTVDNNICTNSNSSFSTTNFEFTSLSDVYKWWNLISMMNDNEIIVNIIYNGKIVKPVYVHLKMLQMYIRIDS